jgi:Protein of unknown function (DUF2281)
MNAQPLDALIEKLKSLPPEQRAEVEDFVDFLSVRAKKRQVDRLFDTMGQLTRLEPPLTEAEIDAEVASARADRAHRR